MKEYLKYASYIVICCTIAYVCATLKDCGEVGGTSDLVVTPADSAFLPITIKEYRPNQLPFQRSTKPKIKLPKNVKESEVSRTIEITNPTLNPSPVRGEKIIIIETKNGDVFVPREKDSLNITVTNYQPSVFEFGVCASVGITVNIQKHFSPSASVAFVRWYGTVDAPVVVADDDGIGIGVGIKLYHEIFLTPAVMWDFETLDKSINLNVSYQL